MSRQDFSSFANSLLNKEVEVITSQGTYSGTLLEVGRDVIILQSRINGMSTHLAIRIELIVAIFRLPTGHQGGPFWGPTPGGEQESTNRQR